MRILLLDFADSDPDPKLKEFKQKTNRIFFYLQKLLKPKHSKSFKPKNEPNMSSFTIFLNFFNFLMKVCNRLKLIGIRKN